MFGRNKNNYHKEDPLDRTYLDNDASQNNPNRYKKTDLDMSGFNEPIDIKDDAYPTLSSFNESISESKILMDDDFGYALKEENIKDKKEKFFGTKKIKKKLKKGEIEEIVFDGDFITQDQRGIVYKHFRDLEDEGGCLYAQQILLYLESNEIWIESEIFSIHEDAWNQIQISLNKSLKKNSSSKNSKLESIAKRYMNKDKYKNPKQDPTDKETHDKITYSYYNIKKTLQNNNKMWITKIIPLSTLERYTYDNPLFDAYARKFQEPHYKKYNAMTEEERMLYNLKKKIIKYIIVFLIILFILSFFTFYSKPRINYKKGQSYFNSQEYDKAYDSFMSANYKDSYNRAGLSLERNYTAKHQYDKALNILEKMQNKQISFNDLILTEEVKDVKYKKAIYLYEKAKFKDAQIIFADLKSYKKAKEYLNKASYKIAENYFDVGDIFNSLYSFSKIKDYKDSLKRYNEIGDGQYEEAIHLYNKSNYEEAKKLFKKLSKVRFKESEDMVNQCTYREGIDLLNRGEYNKSIEKISNIKTFKDSDSLSNEAIYRYAKNLYETDPIKSITQFAIVEGYKDSYEYLKNPKLVIYGEWKVLYINDNKANNTLFKFYEDDTINSNKELINIELSTKAEKKSYKYKEKNVFEFDEKHRIEITPTDLNEIEITAINDQKKTVYKLIRNKTLNELLISEDRSKKIIGEESKDILIKNKIKDFLNDRNE